MSDQERGSENVCFIDKGGEGKFVKWDFMRSLELNRHQRMVSDHLMLPSKRLLQCDSIG